METLDLVWQYVLPIGGGITIGAIVVFIGTIAIKVVVSKLLGKINFDKIADKATEKGVEQIKKISFTQTIQEPLESGLKKVNEMANEKIEKELGDIQAKYDKLLNVITKLAHYFDNSIVPQETKNELYQALGESVEDKKNDIEIKVVEELKEDAKVSKKGTQGVER